MTEPEPGTRRIELAGVRRAPRFRAFVWTGGVVGFAIGVLLVVLAPYDPASEFSRSTAAGFLGMALGLLGALAAGAVAVLADRRSRREL